MPTFQPNSRWSTVADAKLTEACPDGNEFCVLPSGRVRLTTALMECVTACDTICARRRWAPTSATREFPVSRPILHVAIEAPNWNSAPPRMAPGLKPLDGVVSKLADTLRSYVSAVAANVAPSAMMGTVLSLGRRL